MQPKSIWSCLLWKIVSNPKEVDEQSSDLENFRFDWWKGFEKMRATVAPIGYYFIFLELRYFSSIFSSMPKGEIFIMN